MSKTLNEGAMANELAGSTFFKSPDRSASQLVSPPEDQPARQPVREAATRPTDQLAKEPAELKASLVAHHPGIRLLEEHAYDIFQDQARWLSRTKLELEEQYGKRITGNAIVQVALDKLRLEYEKRGEQSDLVQVIVTGKALAPEKGGRR